MFKTRFSLLPRSFVLALILAGLVGCAPLLKGGQSPAGQAPVLQSPVSQPPAESPPSSVPQEPAPKPTQGPTPVPPQIPTDPGQVGEITYETILTTVLLSELPVFLEEYDPGSCDTACLDQHKLVSELAVAYAGRVRFYRITTSEAEFSTGIVYPVYYVIRPSSLRVFDVESGIKTKEELTKFLDDALAALAKAP
jgi:hypothetical protein